MSTDDTLFLSVTQIGRYKECQRAWNLQHRRGLKKRVYETPGYFNMGRAVHVGLEMLHTGSTLQEALDGYDKEYIESAGTGVVMVDGVNAVPPNPYEMAAGRGLLRAYAAHEGVRFDVELGRITKAERGFPDGDDARRSEEERLLTLGEVDGVRVVFCGRYDGFDSRWPAVVEHKTVGQFGFIREDYLLLDEQVSGMCWAASRLEGAPVNTAIYNVVVKPRLKARSRCHSNESPEAYEDRVTVHVMASPSRYFDRFEVHRTPAFLEGWRKSVLDVARAMLSDSALPRNKATWFGPCKSCEYIEICAEWHDDRRRQSVIDEHYSTKEQREAEKEFADV